MTNTLADESGVRIVIVPGRGRLCVCQPAELLRLALSTFETVKVNISLTI